MKICFKCDQKKPLNEYYKHPKMGDGHLNKCKSCAKNDAKIDYVKNSSDLNWKEDERKRCRYKYRRLYVGSGKSNPDAHKRWQDKYPEKRTAQNKSQCLKPPELGTHIHGHHWSYNEEHYKDVIWLTMAEHGKTHRFLKYAQEHKMYRIKHTGELLDTKEKHESYIRYCLKFYED